MITDTSRFVRTAAIVLTTSFPIICTTQKGHVSHTTEALVHFCQTGQSRKLLHAPTVFFLIPSPCPTAFPHAEQESSAAAPNFSSSPARRSQFYPAFNTKLAAVSCEINIKTPGAAFLRNSPSFMLVCSSHCATAQKDVCTKWRNQSLEKVSQELSDGACTASSCWSGRCINKKRFTV